MMPTHPRQTTAQVHNTVLSQRISTPGSTEVIARSSFSGRGTRRQVSGPRAHDGADVARGRHSDAHRPEGSIRRPVRIVPKGVGVPNVLGDPLKHVVDTAPAGRGEPLSTGRTC